MKILLTGATGFIGRTLSEKLVNEGHELYAWVRNLDKAKALLNSQVKCYLHLAEMWDQDFDAVINLAGEPIADKRWTAERKSVLRSSRIDHTHQLVEFIKTQNHKPRVILSGSAIGYYGNQAADTVLDEHSEVATGFTHSLCADWEMAALTLSNETTRVCLLRTGIVLGHGGGALGKMLLPFKLGLGGPVGTGQQMMSWIHLQDWINAALLLLSSDTLSGPFNLVSPNPVNNSTFTKALASALHRPAIFKVPCWGLKLIMGDAAELLCGGQRVLPTKLVNAGYQFKVSTIDQAMQKIVSEGV